MSRESELMIGFALVIAMGCGVSNAAAQTDKYPRMAAIGQYLMKKNVEMFFTAVMDAKDWGSGGAAGLSFPALRRLRMTEVPTATPSAAIISRPWVSPWL